MKKIIFCATMVVAMMLTACGGGGSTPAKDGPKEIQEVYPLLKEVADKVGRINHTPVRDILVEGKNIVLVFELEEIPDFGATIPAVKAEPGKIREAEQQTQSVFTKLFQYGGYDNDDIKVFGTLRKYQYNLVVRIVGDKTRDSIQILALNYESIPANFVSQMERMATPQVEAATQATAVQQPAQQAQVEQVAAPDYYYSGYDNSYDYYNSGYDDNTYEYGYEYDDEPEEAYDDWEDELGWY